MPKDLSLFRDYFKVVKPTDKEITEWKDSLIETSSDDLSSQGRVRQGLEVTFEATHSALFNDNLRFYLPSRMEDGAKTFIQRNKPAKILKHHDSSADPVGVIIGAEYISTIPEGLANNKDVLTLLDSSNSINDQIKASRKLLKSGIPFEDNWRGLGYIKLKGIIYDKETIEQIQDGRFDAVSTSFRSPGEAYCSECRQNLAKEGFCDHSPGGKYTDGEEDDNGVICGIIPGVHNYDEVSLVVFDGDPLTQIAIGHQDSNKEFKISMDNWNKTSEERPSNIAYSFRDFKEEENMADPKVEKPANQEIDSDLICDEMQVELKAMLDEELITSEEWEAADAKLSTEQRKKLSKSTFCGPDRSFPVPDCAHVTAARRLIGRYEGPGNKDEILACVDRKAKALGCDSKKEDKAVVEDPQEDKFELPTCELVGKLNDDETKELFNMAEAEMISRNLKLDRPCGKCAAHEDEAKKNKQALDDSIKQNEELNNQLNVLREELRFQIADYMAQVDKYVELGASLTAAQKDHLALVGVLNGKFESVEIANDSLKDANIEEQKPVIMADFKIEDVMSKMNDGMPNTPDPSETVDDPTDNNDIDNKQLADGLSQSAISAIENIRDFINDDKILNAKRLYGKMVGLKVIDPKIVPFDSLSAKKEDKTAE